MAKKEITRDYTGEDEAMRTRAQVFHDQLADELALFTAKFPEIDATWNSDFQDDIDNAEEFPTDDATRGDITQLTEDISGPSKQGLEQLEELDTYAKLRFADKPSLQKIFGRANWEAARSDTEKLIKALEDAFDWANDADVNPTLVSPTSGYTAGQVTALNTRAGEIRDRNRLQEKAKNKRPITTEDRVVLHNLVFARMRTLNTAAQLVHKDSPAALASYNLYASGSGNPTTTVTFTVLRSGTPQKDVTCKPTNADLAPVVTADDGLAAFSSTLMPNELEMEFIHATIGTHTETFTVVEGEENEFEVNL